MVAAKILTDINVPTGTVVKNILCNSKKKVAWLDREEHKIFKGKVAVIGGSPSIENKIEEIRQFKEDGGMIMSTNGTHDYLVDNNIEPDFFVQLDARAMNKFACKPIPSCIYLLASQCNPGVFKRLQDHHLILWHCEHDDFPRKQVNELYIKKYGFGSWTSVGARKTVGLTSICLAYTLGFTDIYIYGMDSSFDDYQHAYEQKQNEKDQIVTSYVGNKEFKTTPTLLNQAQLYGYLRGNVEMNGCKLHMRSEGLIKAMHEAKDSMTPEQREAVKYIDMWDVDGYRVKSPGLEVAPKAMSMMPMPEGSKLIDFGVGSGKAAWAFKKAGYNVLGVDIAANCLDIDKLIPLCIAPLWDVPDNVQGQYGYCTDVMEHIPTNRVNDVLTNIKKCISEKVFFQIDLHEDAFGEVIGDVLHLTVKPPEWWRVELEKVFTIEKFEPNRKTLLAVVS